MTGPARAYGGGTYGSGLWGMAAVPAEPVMVTEVWAPGGWVDASCDGRSIDVNRGRSSYVGAFAAGTATLVFANDDGRYSAWSVFGLWAGSSPYRVDVPIRVRVMGTDGATSPVFVGTTDAVADEWPGITDAQATVTASDAFKYLARRTGLPRAAVGAGELTGARVNRLADDAAYTGPRAVDVGTVPLQATTLEGVALDLLRQVGESEWGWLFMSADNVLTFRQRDVVQTDPRMTTVQWTFVDEHLAPPAAPGICYTDLRLAVDDDAVVNVAQVTPPGVATQTAQDAPSVAWFGPRTWTRTDLPIQGAPEALGLAQLVVLQGASASRRVEGISFRASGDAAAYACAIGVRIGDRVRVIRHYPDGYVLDAELLVNSIHHAITADGSGHPRVWDVDLGTFGALLVRDFGQWDGPAGAGIGGWDVSTWGV